MNGSYSFYKQQDKGGNVGLAIATLVIIAVILFAIITPIVIMSSNKDSSEQFSEAMDNTLIGQLQNAFQNMNGKDQKKKSQYGGCGLAYGAANPANQMAESPAAPAHDAEFPDEMDPTLSRNVVPKDSYQDIQKMILTTTASSDDSPTSAGGEEGYSSCGEPQCGGSPADRTLDRLMPVGFRASNSAKCPSALQRDDALWTRYAPTRHAFDNANTAGGSVRLGLNTRDPMTSRVGVPNLLRPGTVVPISTNEVVLYDTDARQQAIYDSEGYYPQNDSC